MSAFNFPLHVAVGCLGLYCGNACVAQLAFGLAYPVHDFLSVQHKLASMGGPSQTNVFPAG